jgi:glycosyltransferase involved in cell wall biosynthesis
LKLKKNKNYLKNLKELTRELKINEKVFFHDKIEDVEKVYKSFDISLMFSESESFSMICAESQFYGIPVIATKCGGPSEIIDNMENGILVENKNVFQMTEAMNKLATNIKLRQIFSQKGQHKISSLSNKTTDFYTIISNNN